MKKIILSIISTIVFTLVWGGSVFAQGPMGNTTGSDGHTAREEAEGKAIWEKLQTKQVACSDLSNEEFEVLGEYFMGKMMGTSHEAMNKMMVQMIGKESEEQMHVAMGKRMSGCEPNAPMPQNMPALSGVEGMGSGMMPMMMNMMLASGRSLNWFGWDFGWILMILFWGFVILGIVALIKWLMNQSRGKAKSRSALDILKKRYVKGEIDKKEFEEKKKDLMSKIP